MVSVYCDPPTIPLDANVYSRANVFGKCSEVVWRHLVVVEEFVAQEFVFREGKYRVDNEYECFRLKLLLE